MKKIKARAKMRVQAAQATPAPPVGSTLAQYGINISDFCQQFNNATKDMAGWKLPVKITIYDDGTFNFTVKQPPASALIKKELGIEKGSGQPSKKKIGKITRAQLKAVAEKKMADLNANDIEAAARIVEGTAKNMGLNIEN